MKSEAAQIKIKTRKICQHKIKKPLIIWIYFNINFFEIKIHLNIFIANITTKHSRLNNFSVYFEQYQNKNLKTAIFVIAIKNVDQMGKVSFM